VNFLPVPRGFYRIGTTREGVRDCVRQWKHRLINPCYDETSFQEWIEKEFPNHSVPCGPFELQQTLVSNADAKSFLLDHAQAAVPESVRIGDPEDHPVWGVSLEWAQSFADWLSRCDLQYRYRLPSETEWEVAARGDDFRQYPYGEEFNPHAANTIEGGRNGTTPIYAYERTCGPFGHCDLAGNIEEWVSTKYYIYPEGRLIADDLYQRLGQNYSILRGGSFACGGDLSRAARRHGPFPDPTFRYTGFRLIREKKSL
jgi:toxoflavin biosynthesis protein ToxD